MYISMRGQKILKIIHLLTVSYWIGGCLAVLTLLYASFGAQNDDEFFGILLSSRFVGIIVVVYMGAFASFFTGLAYSICTNRGFVRHKWIIIKWVITVYLIVFGASLSAPWSARMLELADSMGLAALDLGEFQVLRGRLLAALSTQMLLLIVATVISVYRPWEEKENAFRRGKGGLKARKGTVLPGRLPGNFEAGKGGAEAQQAFGLAAAADSRQRAAQAPPDRAFRRGEAEKNATAETAGGQRPKSGRTRESGQARRLFPGYSKMRRK